MREGGRDDDRKHDAPGRQGPGVCRQTFGREPSAEGIRGYVENRPLSATVERTEAEGPRERMRKNMNVPNLLTLSRIAAIPAVVLLMYYRVWHPEAALASQLACAVFAVACITDLVDGHIARSYKVITNLGKFLDPLADKLLILSALIMLVRLEWAPAWVVIIILARELSVTGMRAMAADEGVVIAADRFGKLKTLTQSFAIGILIWNVPLFGVDLNPLGMALLYIALALTVFSGINYFRNYYMG